MSILLTGGAGYIGSHVNKILHDRGFETVVIDDESTGHKEKINKKSIFISGDIRHTELVRKTIVDHEIKSVIHLAAKKSVSESFINPQEYRSVNIDGTASVVEACLNSDVKHFLFSSSAAVYGNSDCSIVSENEPTNPVSYYGETKLEAEKIISANFEKTNIAYINLRYFNVVGSSDRTLRDVSNENLFPIIKESIENGEGPFIFGSDYPTPDGTCIRDYVHVQDIAEIHARILQKWGNLEFPRKLNVGSGQGFSVFEVIAEFLKQTNSDLKPQYSKPRAGDPAKLIADIDMLKASLNFTPSFTLSEMVASTL
jgi:UDP-glucose 4-epimerase